MISSSWNWFSTVDWQLYDDSGTLFYGWKNCSMLEGTGWSWERWLDWCGPSTRYLARTEPPHFLPDDIGAWLWMSWLPYSDCVAPYFFIFLLSFAPGFCLASLRSRAKPSLASEAVQELTVTPKHTFRRCCKSTVFFGKASISHPTPVKHV